MSMLDTVGGWFKRAPKPPVKHEESEWLKQSAGAEQQRIRDDELRKGQEIRTAFLKQLTPEERGVWRRVEEASKKRQPIEDEKLARQINELRNRYVELAQSMAPEYDSKKLEEFGMGTMESIVEAGTEEEIIKDFQEGINQLKAETDAKEALETAELEQEIEQAFTAIQEPKSEAAQEGVKEQAQEQKPPENTAGMPPPR